MGEASDHQNLAWLIPYYFLDVSKNLKSDPAMGLVLIFSDDEYPPGIVRIDQGGYN